MLPSIFRRILRPWHNDHLILIVRGDRQWTHVLNEQVLRHYDGRLLLGFSWAVQYENGEMVVRLELYFRDHPYFKVPDGRIARSGVEYDAGNFHDLFSALKGAVYAQCA